MVLCSHLCCDAGVHSSTNEGLIDYKKVAEQCTPASQHDLEHQIL